MSRGPKRQTVLVSGASSQIGVFLLPLLDAGSFRVRALSRSAPSVPRAVTDSISWIHPKAELAAEERGDSPAPELLVSAGPQSLARRLLARHPGIRTAVVFSSSSVISKADSPHRGERERIANILADEQSLKQACGERGVTLVLIRPTLVYGCGMDHNISLLYRLAQGQGLGPVSTRAGGQRQPVHAADLADLALAALSYRETALLEGQACGGSTLSYHDMAAAIAQCGPRRARLMELPPALFSTLVSLWSLTRRGEGVNREMVRRQARDLVFDDSGFRRMLNYRPRAFRPQPVDFELPPGAGVFRPGAGT